MQFEKIFLFIVLFMQSLLSNSEVFYPKYNTLSHTVGKGVGYDSGYTTVESTFFPNLCKRCFWTFTDLRFHIVNDGTVASNLGMGIRYQPCNFSQIFGFNVYYDFRRSDRKFNYNQIGFGFEILSCCYDFRVNAYIPFDRERIIDYCVFDQYEDGYVIRRKEVENAFRGFSVEFGRPFCFSICNYTYFALGGYFFKENICHTSLGSYFRSLVFVKNYLFFEGKISYDALFKTRLQGKIGLSIPLGRCSYKRGSCPQYQPVYRNELIVLDEFCKWKWNY